MLPGERTVGGLRCSEVLALLDAFAEGSLSHADQSRIQAHVAGCSVCEQFGRRYATLIERFKNECAQPDPVDAGATSRLVARVVAAVEGS